jgi:tetratricopeptide (TPR) repeat protein
MNLMENAKRLYEEGNYLGSLEIVLKVLENEPDNLKALEIKANLFLIEDKLPEAIRSYKELLRSFDSDYDYDVWAQLFVLNAISSSYCSLKNFDQAISYCEKSIELCERFLKVDNPQKEGFLEALVGKLWILGEYQRKIREYSRAVDTYKKLLKILSEFGCLETIADALFELASAYYELNRTTEFGPYHFVTHR